MGESPVPHGGNCLICGQSKPIGSSTKSIAFKNRALGVARIWDEKCGM